MPTADEQLLLEILLLIVAPVIVGPLITKWVGDREKRLGGTPAKVRGLRVLITVIWVAVVGFGLFLTVGTISFLSTLTFSAIAGIGVTLALTTTLQNLVAGLILLQERSLRVGDLVQFSGTKGKVVAFGLVTTVIKLDDGTLAFVSNSNLLSGPLINFTAGKRLSGEY